MIHSCFVILFDNGESEDVVAVYRNRRLAQAQAEVENKTYKDRGYSGNYSVDEWVFADNSEMYSER